MAISKGPQNARIWTWIKDSGDYEESKEIVKSNIKNEQEKKNREREIKNYDKKLVIRFK